MENANAKPSRLMVVGSAVTVFVAALFLRLPSCYESFWLDELHTAWAIWGELADVAPRAEIGNQTPLYFQLMWLWKQLVGETEVALRLSSVLMVSLASALLVVAVTQSTRQISAGLLAGLILAVESNSLFFGTEFRPYASLILLSVVATWAAVALIKGNSPVRPANLRLILIIAACLATVLHPTGLVTFGILVVTALMLSLAIWMRSTDRSVRLQISDLASVVIVFATFMALANSSLSESWEQRELWRAFGRATQLKQLWTIWPWAATVLAPVVFGVPFVWKRTRKEIFAALLPLLTAIAATVVFFLASYHDLVPLWHRRYFVAALPMLAWTAGVWATMGLLNASDWPRLFLACILIVWLSAWLMWQQATLQRLVAGKTQLVTRGENWRAAIRFVNAQREADDRVFLDSGFIEVNRFNSRLVVDATPSQMEWGYFKFPISGPYSTRADTGSPNMHPERAVSKTLLFSPRNILIISRSQLPTLQNWCNSFTVAKFNRPQYYRFGRIWVVRIQGPTYGEWNSRRLLDLDRGFSRPIYRGR